jgi:RHS repeat-associated protein
MEATGVTARQQQRHAPSRRLRTVLAKNNSLNDCPPASRRGTARFLWGGDSDWQCLEERDGSDNLVARFTYAPGYIDAVAVQERDLNADSDFGDTNEVAYYQANTLFSVYALSDADGAVVERYRYDAYGGCTVLDADGSADADGLSDVGNPYLFTGRGLDLETGLMQYRHRYYSPGLGRFMSRDLCEYEDSYALYGYADSSPADNTDPSGLAKEIGRYTLWVPPESLVEKLRANPFVPPDIPERVEASRRPFTVVIYEETWKFWWRGFREGWTAGMYKIRAASALWQRKQWNEEAHDRFKAIGLADSPVETWTDVTATSGVVATYFAVSAIGLRVATRVNVDFKIHPPGHDFPVWGKVRHFMINVYRVGISKSQILYKQIPFPFIKF